MQFVIKAAGPYIGPKGGKWADPEHTIPWVPEPHGQLTADQAAETEQNVDAKGKHAGQKIDETKAQRIRARGNHVLVHVPLYALDAQFDDPTTPPGEKQKERIAEYAKLDTKMPPIYIQHGERDARRGKQTAFVSNGNHRVAAAHLRGDTHIDAIMPESDYHRWVKTRGQEVDTSKSLTNSSITKSEAYDAKFLNTLRTQQGEVRDIGQGRFGAKQVVFPNGVKGTLKSRLFSSESFRGIKRNTQYLREIAAYKLDKELLGWGIIPMTVMSAYQGQPASVQEWVTGVPAGGIVPDVFKKAIDGWKDRVAIFASKVNTEKLRKIVLFDLIVNNVDRHGKNALFDLSANEAWAIDNGLCFGRFYHKYYNVFHKYLYRQNLVLTKTERKILESLTLNALSLTLQRYLSDRDIRETAQRVQWMLAVKDLGFSILTQGLEGRNDFPDNKDWFIERKDEEQGNKVLLALASMGEMTQPAMHAPQFEGTL